MEIRNSLWGDVNLKLNRILQDWIFTAKEMPWQNPNLEQVLAPRQSLFYQPCLVLSGREPHWSGNLDWSLSGSGSWALRIAFAPSPEWAGSGSLAISAQPASVWTSHVMRLIDVALVLTIQATWFPLAPPFKAASSSSSALVVRLAPVGSKEVEALINVTIVQVVEGWNEEGFSGEEGHLSIHILI